MANPNFHKIKKIGIGRYLTKVKYAYMWDGTQFQRVWSGASEVSYYDGNTLLGTEEVEDGADALHPSISTAKSGYTLYGWATKKNPTPSDRVTTYLADGDPKTLYAIYLPNTLVVVSGSGSGGVNDYPSYNTAIQNTEYVTGGVFADASLWYQSGRASASATFTLNKRGLYQTATATIWSASRGNGTAKFDGSIIAQNAEGWRSGYTTRVIANGNHTLETSLYVDESEGSSWRACQCGVTNITLSNPIAWT